MGQSITRQSRTRYARTGIPSRRRKNWSRWLSMPAAKTTRRQWWSTPSRFLGVRPRQVRDEVTTIFATHPRYAAHDYPGHPETAQRIRAVWRGLDESGLSARMRPLEAEAVDTEWVLTVHSAVYLDLL